jgi:nucleoside-diphosphate-sugar epimerase
MSSHASAGGRPIVVAITGAAGNLGGLLARHMLANTEANLRLLIHRRDLPDDLRTHPRVSAYQCDLAEGATVVPALAGADCVVHFAGVLFKARPGRFLPTTNTEYFRNLLSAAIRQRVRRIVLISFPHVEGETTPEHPATGRLDGNPASVHARTRLEEERLLFDAAGRHGIEAVSLRVGMVYGRGILMIDAARWLSQRRLLGVWKEPTWIHLISKDDFVAATGNAVIRPDISGIYHLGDEGRQTLQEFLDTSAMAWGTTKPWRLPLGFIYAAARLCEWQSMLFGTASPLTQDLITIGRCSYYGDTARMRAELLPQLRYATLALGRQIL